MAFRCEAVSLDHDVEAFDSGVEVLDDWLRVHARHSDGRDLTRTYVFHAGDGIAVAYYTLLPFSIDRGTLTRRQGRGLVDRIPAYLLARLALDRRLHGQGLGSAVLASAVSRAALAGRQAGG